MMGRYPTRELIMKLSDAERQMIEMLRQKVWDNMRAS